MLVWLAKKLLSLAGEDNYSLFDIAPRKAKKLNYSSYMDGWNDGYDKRFVDLCKDKDWKAKPDMLTDEECKYPYPKVLGYFEEDLTNLKFLDMPSLLKDAPNKLDNTYIPVRNRGYNSFLCLNTIGYDKALSLIPKHNYPYREPIRFPCIVQFWYSSENKSYHTEFYYNNVGLLLK